MPQLAQGLKRGLVVDGQWDDLNDVGRVV